MLLLGYQWPSNLSSIVFCCLLYVLHWAESSVKISVGSINPPPVTIRNQTFVLPGSSLDITCESVASTLPGSSITIKGPTLETRTGTNKVTLQLTSISANKHGGAYSCEDKASADHYYLNVWDDNSLIAPHVVTNGTVGHVTLQCIQKFKEPLPLIWRYEKDSRILNDVPKTDHTFFVKPDTKWNLTVTNTGRHSDKTGKYICEVDLTNETRELRKLSKEVIYTARPDVRFLDADYNKAAIKTEDHSLTCIYGGHNTVETKWIWRNNTRSITIFDFNDTRTACPAGVNRLCTNTSSRFQLYKDEDQEKYKDLKLGPDEAVSVLFVRNIDQYDRGEFWCFAANEHGENGAMVFLRVKDRYAALWPFLGVVAEILVLALVICLCERKRNKQLAVEEEEEAALMRAHRDDVGQDKELSVRNRK